LSLLGGDSAEGKEVPCVRVCVATLEDHQLLSTATASHSQINNCECQHGAIRTEVAIHRNAHLSLKRFSHHLPGRL
jgi:hypothetical protein